MAARRVLVVANKWWECDPLINVLLNDNARPKALPWLEEPKLPRRRPVPRALLRLSRTQVEIWCISDLLDRYPDQSKFQSSSELKMRHLPQLFAGEPPALVIAFGTAAHSVDASQNGNVVLGTGVFMHNGHPGGTNLDSNWETGPFDQLLESPLPEPVFNAIASSLAMAEVTPRFLGAALNPASVTAVLARHDYAALGTINVTNYAEYAAADKQTMAAFKAVADQSRIGSLETTHGLIRACTNAPFLFVSGIANRIGHFDTEVQPRSYSQNTAAAHNAGIVLAWLLPGVDRFLE